ncbi:MAG: META domain-containing protein [Gammaproteobacteria bacterium]|nr:MAG: META domain-containing protein [Gammaproteobacteria bacterium]
MSPRILMFLALLLPAACERGPEAPVVTPAAELLDTRWKLIAIENQPIITKPPPDEAHLLLSSDDNTVAGYSGCNRFSGGFTRQDGALSFGPLMSTRRACIDSMDLEANYLQALGRVDRIEIVERELRMFDGEDLLLTFMAVDAL